MAFDTIDHQIMFHILEHSLGITDSDINEIIYRWSLTIRSN